MTTPQATLDAAQLVLNVNRFQDNGRDLFPLSARDLTAAQVARVLCLGEKVRRLAGLKATERRLKALKDSLSTLAT
jgi:hypothetical protein